MKNSKWFWILAAAYVLTGVVSLWYTQKQHKRTVALLSVVQRQQNDMYSLMTTWMESGEISRQIVPPEGLLTPGCFVLAFPNQVCDVCNIWLFNQVKALQGSVQIEGIAPVKVKKDVMVFNANYELQLADIKSSDAFILPEIYQEEKDFAYIFYYSEDGKMQYPLLLNNKAINLKTYIQMVQMLTDR